MNQSDIIAARKRAESAVVDMPEGDLKTKAFEVLFGKLLDNISSLKAKPTGDPRVRADRDPESDEATETPGTSLNRRILYLKQEGFFEKQRSLGDIKSELAMNGWHYPVTTLSGAVQGLVQRRGLRRERVVEGKKKLWKYSLP